MNWDHKFGMHQVTMNSEKWSAIGMELERRKDSAVKFEDESSDEALASPQPLELDATANDGSACQEVSRSI